MGLIGSYWLPIDVCLSNSFFHSRQPAAPALFFLAFLTRCPLSFSRGLCFLVRTAPILQQALQFLSLEPSAQAVLANSSGLCVYLEQLAKPWCLTGQTNQVPSGTTSKQDMPKTGIPRRVWRVFPFRSSSWVCLSIVPWLGADAGAADDDGWKHHHKHSPLILSQTKWLLRKASNINKPSQIWIKAVCLMPPIFLIDTLCVCDTSDTHFLSGWYPLTWHNYGKWHDWFDDLALIFPVVSQSYVTNYQGDPRGICSIIFYQCSWLIPPIFSG